MMGDRSPNPLRGAVVGCGFFGRNHLHAWHEIEGVDLVAVCDRDRQKVGDAAAAFGATPYTDAQGMLAREPLDFVDIVTTMPTHRALAELVLQAGVVPIVQKPLAPTYEDGLAMVEAAEAAGRPLVVHENFRFQAPMRRVRGIVSSGTIGEPTFARISFRTAHDVYRNQPYLAQEKDLIVLDLGIHLLDLARVFMGEVLTVQAAAQRVNPRVQGEDQATILLRHESGAVTVVDCSFESRRAEDLFPQTLVEIDGTAGSVSVGPHFELAVVANGTVSREHAAPQPRSWAGGPSLVVQDSVAAACAHFAAELARGAAPEPSGADNLRTYALVDAAYRSARSGRPEAPRGRPTADGTEPVGGGR